MQMLKILTVALALAAAALPVSAIAQDLLANPPHSAATHEAELLGARLFAYDQVAWHATDRLVEDLEKSGDDPA